MLWGENLIEGSRCCSTKAYNPVQDICCLGNILPKAGFKILCCGRVNFNPRTYICCGGRITSKATGRTRCCGGQAYNPTRFQCCLPQATLNPIRISCRRPNTEIP